MTPQEEQVGLFSGWLEVINRHLDTSLKLDSAGRLCLQMVDVLVGLELSVEEGVYRIYAPLLEIRDSDEIAVLAEALSLNLLPHAVGVGSIGLDTESGWIVYSVTQNVESSGPEMLAMQLERFPATAASLRGCLKQARDPEAGLSVTERTLLADEPDLNPDTAEAPAPQDPAQPLA